MPVYEYSCLECDQDFELFLRGEDQPACPHCASTRLERRMSLPARPASGGTAPDVSRLGPPAGGGGCGSGSCGCH